MEFNADGTENMYRDIPRERVLLFGLQSAQSSYFMNLTDGRFYIKDYRQDRTLGISIPVDGKIVQIGGKLQNGRYPFFQLKSGYQDMARRPGQAHISSGGNVITEHIIGWRRQVLIKKYGLVDAEVTLSLDPRPSVIQPKISVTLNPPGVKKPIAGSPYVISL
jgi:hypothetical protein